MGQDCAPVGNMGQNTWGKMQGVFFLSLIISVSYSDSWATTEGYWSEYKDVQYYWNYKIASCVLLAQDESKRMVPQKEVG